MADFDNYSTLQASIMDTLNRADLAGAIPKFIALVEGKVNADDRFRCLSSLVRSTSILANQYMALPSDYLSMQNFRNLGPTVSPLPGNPPMNRLDELTTAQADVKRQLLPTTDRPQFFINLGQEFELLPAPDQEYNAMMVYFAKVPPLATSTTGTNWLLQTYPNVYYYGALLEAAPYLRNDDRISVWSSMYEQIAEQIHVSNQRGQFSGAPMKMRVNKRYR